MLETEYRISFIIPVLNGDKYISYCLNSILNEMNEAKDEIIVVDNGSDDETIQIVSKFINITTIIRPGITIAALRNTGASLSKGNILAFIDSDCTVSPGWRNAVVRIFKDKHIAATGSHYDIPENSNWIEKAWCSNRVKHKSIVRWINSCNLVVRREVFDEIKGFNNNLKTDEDHDFGKRICEAGYKIMEEPQIRVIHYKNPKTIKSFFTRERWYAISMLSKINNKKFDKTLIATLIFILFFFGLVISIPLSLLDIKYPIFCLISVLLLPLVTTFLKIKRFHNYNYLFQIYLLFIVYFTARSITIFETLIKNSSFINFRNE